MRHASFTLLLASAVACGGSKESSGGIVNPSDTKVATVSVLPGSLSLTAGATGRLTAEARSATGTVIPGASVTWTTSMPSVATVAIDGTVTAVDGGTATISANVGGRVASAAVYVELAYDIATRGVPKLITADYIELAKIARIARFRSGIGHDYSDDAERCRSMKHYFMPRSGLDWSTVVISSPVSGKITELLTETTFGTQVRLTPTAYPAFTVTLFHVKLDAGLTVGSTVTAGQRLGTHIGTQTMSDVALRVRVPNGSRNVSYFDAMSDAVFQGYSARGLASRAAAIIPAAERDASPLTCSGEQFESAGSLVNWLELAG